MSALNSKSRLTAMSTQYSNPMAAKPSKRQVYGRKGRRRLDPLKKKKRSPSPEVCSAHWLPNPIQYIFAPEPITDEEIEARKSTCRERLAEDHATADQPQFCWPQFPCWLQAACCCAPRDPRMLAQFKFND